MKLKLRATIAIGGAISIAAALGQLSACATAGDNAIADAGTDVVFHPRPPTGDGGGLDGSTCASDPCVVAIALGGAHTCALLHDGTVRCWGDNFAGELGQEGVTGDAGIPLDSGTQSQTPRAVSGITGAVGIAAGGPFGSASYDNDVTCAFSPSGPPVCWGSNQYDMLGRGTAPDTIAHPDFAAVSTLAASSIISLGQTSGCAVTAGALSCWGSNSYQQLGQPLDGGFGSSTPVPVALPGGKKAIEVASGYGHSCAVLEDNTVACWGYDFYAQCGTLPPSGDSQPTPVLVAGLSGVAHIALGSYHSCAVSTAGGVSCWGYNYQGSLGNGGWDGGYQDPTPLTAILPTGRKATQVAAGTYSTCALLDDGTVACWGFNSYGQTGLAPDGGLGIVATPSVVAGITGAVQIAMGAGSQHVCARLNTGGVKCWGANTTGQLGADTGDAGTMSATPLDVAF